MALGAFSISLSVKDLAASRAFYEALGFTPMGGDEGAGWDQDAQAVDPFTDVREIQRRLKDAGLTFVQEADESTTGPASFIVVDPDGNPVLFDQHR